MAIQAIEQPNFDLTQQFYEAGMKAYENVVFGEKDARTLLLLGYAGRSAVLLAGSPGGAKSRLAKYAHRIFEDIEDNDIAIVPPDSQLQPIQLVGGVARQSKETTRDGVLFTEDIVNTIVPIIGSNTKAIWLDEGTRISPWAMNAALGAPEEKVLKTTAGEVELNDLQILITTMNASETKEATFKMSAAMSSRHSGGVIMGGELEIADAIQLVQGRLPDPNKIEAFTNTKQLAEIQANVANILLPEDEAKFAARAVTVARAKLLEDYNIREENRMLVQVGQMAKTLGMFRGGKATPEDVQDALKFALGSRIGALVSGKDSASELNKTWQAVLSKAA